MQAVTAASLSAESIYQLPAQFMMDARTYERGSELGFEGIDFYFAGRAGVLGEVSGAVVAAALVFFEPGTVAAAWERGRAVLAPGDSSLAFAGCAADWAEAHLPDGVDYRRLAELQGQVIAGASTGGAPLFAGWAAQPEPSSPKELALHRMNVLRELRGAMHGASVLAAGLSPLEALAVCTPFMAGVFGWGEVDLPDAEVCRTTWEGAEEATNRAMARHLAVLDEAQRGELVELLASARRDV